MKLAGAKKQTIFLTGINGIVRTLGLAMRVLLSRALGAEVIGVMELAQSIHMVAIAPLTSGLPVAISRLTARAGKPNKRAALEAGLRLVRRASFLLVPALWLLSPAISNWMGDIRVLPSLWFTAPCILILGYSASYNGYCYGIEQSTIPAMSELIEQAVRFALTFVFIRCLHSLTIPWLSAIPAAATMVAEVVGLIWVISVLPKRNVSPVPSSAWTNAVLRLSLPSTANRLIQTVLRSITSILIPKQLQVYGLSAAEATAQLGRLNGMVMPILMLPGIFTSALSMVIVPRIAKAEEQPSELRRLLLISLCASVPIAGICVLLVYGCAPLLAIYVYHQAELTVLFRFCAFQIMLFSVNHLIGSTLSALGQQRRSLYASALSAVCSVLLTWLWTAQSGMNGVIRAQYASQILSIVLGSFALLCWKQEQRLISDGKSA